MSNYKEEFTNNNLALSAPPVIITLSRLVEFRFSAVKSGGGLGRKFYIEIFGMLHLK
jgi:hypothetical protein